MKRLSVADVATHLGQSPNAVAADVPRNPDTLPPRLFVPRPRQLRWRPADVKPWISRVKTRARRGRK